MQFLKSILKVLGLAPAVATITANDLLEGSGQPVRYVSTIDQYGRKSAELVAVDPADAEAAKLAKGVNAKSEAVDEFRLRYMQAYEPSKFLKMCAARKIDPEVFGPPIPNMPTDFRNWPVAA